MVKALDSHKPAPISYTLSSQPPPEQTMLPTQPTARYSRLECYTTTIGLRITPPIHSPSNTEAVAATVLYPSNHTFVPLPPSKLSAMVHTLPDFVLPLPSAAFCKVFCGQSSSYLHPKHRDNKTTESGSMHL